MMERLALHELHREVWDALRIHEELVHGNDVRVLELPRDLRLGDEAVAVKGLLGELLGETLEGDVAQEVSVGRRMNATHASSTELRVELEVLRRRNAFAGDFLCR